MKPGSLSFLLVIVTAGTACKKNTPATQASVGKKVVVPTIAGSSSGYANGDGASAKFNYPGGLGIDAQGNVYVTDLRNNRIRRISFE